jgi:TctA family transporter
VPKSAGRDDGAAANHHFLPAEGALIMLAGIYYGAQYGGSTTAISSICPARRAR